MLSIIKKVLPDAYELLLRRYHILNVISQEGPIGRRLLSEKVQFTERSIRSEVEILKEAHLISTTKAGMLLTAEGLDTLNQLRELLEEENYLLELQNKLAKHLDIQSC